MRRWAQTVKPLHPDAKEVGLLSRGILCLIGMSEGTLGNLRTSKLCCSALASFSACGITQHCWFVGQRKERHSVAKQAAQHPIMACSVACSQRRYRNYDRHFLLRPPRSQLPLPVPYPSRVEPDCKNLQYVFVGSVPRQEPDTVHCETRRRIMPRTSQQRGAPRSPQAARGIEAFESQAQAALRLCRHSNATNPNAIVEK